jgi:hypothetical protein
MAEQWIAVASADFKQRVDVLITKGSALSTSLAVSMVPCVLMKPLSA